MEKEENIWDKIGSTGNVVVEASAGTGKTFALENIFQKLVCGSDAGIESILLVTFTEKAAAELRERIRSRLEISAADPDLPPAERIRVKNALDNYDLSSISTIHSFCHRVLREYAFENSQALSPELDNTDALTKAALERLIYSSADKADDASADGIFSGTELYAVIFSAAAAALFKDPGKYEGVLEKLVQISGEADFVNGDRLVLCSDASVPPIVEASEISKLPSEMNLRIDSLGRRLKRFCEAAPGGEGGGDWWTGVVLKSIKKEYAGVLDGIRSIVCGSCGSQNRIARFCRLLSKDFGTYADVFKKTGCKLGDAEKEEICGIFSEGSGIFKQCLATVQEWLNLFCRSIYESSSAMRRGSGLVSHNDMVRNVRDTLLPSRGNPGAVRILNAIRRRYRAALVDEFQDTDPAQWEIFSRLFTDLHDREYEGAENFGNRLIVVGDPKQAIYSFRGASVNTYFKAVEELSRGTDFKRFELGVTYRCTDAMCDAFNVMFSGEEWFGGDMEFKYPGVRTPHPNPKRIKEAGMPDAASGPPVYVFVPSGEDADAASDGGNAGRPGSRSRASGGVTNGVAYSEFAGFIASEIRRLMSEDCRVYDKEYPDGRHLTESDFCVLVRNNTDVRHVENAFRAAGIHFSYKGYADIGESAEAEAVYVLLKYLSGLLNGFSSPNALLLSDIFALPPDAVIPGRYEDEKRLLAELSRRWLELAERRLWAAVFRSAVYDTGLAYRHAAAGKDPDDSVEMYSQVFEMLVSKAGARADNIDCYIEAMRSIIGGTGDKEARTCAADRNCVNVMTLHASKGLEFPVVFLSAGCGSGKDDGSAYAERGGRVVREFLAGKDLGKPTSQRAADDKCLYYVAMTRAEYRLYVLCVRDGGANHRLMNELLVPAFDRLLKSTTGNLAEEVEACGTDMYGERDSEEQSETNGAPSGSRAFPAIFVLPSLRQHRFYYDSFSSVHESLKAAEDGAVSPGDDARDGKSGEDEGEWDMAAQGSRSDVRTCLPPGTTSGTAFHSVMEALCKAASAPDFESVGRHASAESVLADKGLSDLITEKMRLCGLVNRRIRPELCGGDPLFCDSVGEMALMVWKALTFKLPFAGVRLADIPPCDRLTELEFEFSEEDVLYGQSDRQTGRHGAAMTGFIDLLFRSGGRYYVVDWKTNLLDGYDPASVGEKMRECGYDIQYGIYLLALDRWLRSFAGMPECTGGAIYLFVRGGSVSRGSDPGVFCEEWTGESRGRMRERIIGKLRAARSRLLLRSS